MQLSKSFAHLVAASHPDVEVRTQARSGWSTADWLTHVGDALGGSTSDIEAVVILLGTNDSRSSEANDVMVAHAAERLARLADELRQRAPQARIVIAAPVTVDAMRLTPRLRDAGYGVDSADRLRELGHALRELARAHRYAFVDLFPVVRPENLLDGVHPDATGHREIADAIQPALFGAR